MTDIKKAFNTFKKDIKAEGLDLTGRCYMTAKQLQKNTATILICNTISYEKEIKDAIGHMSLYLDENDTSKNKARNIEYYSEAIERYSEALSQYGTKQNEYEQVTKQILASKAWEKFARAIGTAVYTTDETKDIFKYLRIMW